MKMVAKSKDNYCISLNLAVYFVLEYQILKMFFVSHVNNSNSLLSNYL